MFEVQQPAHLANQQQGTILVFDEKKIERKRKRDIKK
jgi:hypothetical protein